MKISEWSYEVLEGPMYPVYVYEAPVRFWHWTQAVCFVLLTISGFLIGSPLPSNFTDTWSTYLFADIIAVHVICGMFFAALMLYRIYWAAVGNCYSRMIFILPVWDALWWSGMARTALHYLFLRKHPPVFIGHNPLAQTAMFVMYVLASLGIILTGFALYAEQWGIGTGWMVWFGWVFDLAGGAQPVRTAHHVLMYVLLIFFSFHLYMSFREDIMGHETQLSTITNGIRFFKEKYRRGK